jgi:lipoprotein
METPRVLANIKLFIVVSITISCAIALVPYPYNILMVFMIMLCILIVANTAYDVGLFAGSVITSQIISRMLQLEIDKQTQMKKEMVKE